MFLDALGSYAYVSRLGLAMLLAALSVHLLLRAGLFAVPQVGFMAIGGYCSGIMSHHDVAGWPLRLLAAALVSALAGALLAALLTRLDGLGLALATIAFATVITSVASNLSATGGSAGLVGIFPLPPDWLLVGLAVTACGGLYLVYRGRLGATVDALARDNLLASHLGVSIFVSRLALFAASGALAGLGGALYVQLSGFVAPNMFTFDTLTTLLAIAIVGGMRSPLGAVVGTVIILGLPEVLSSVGEYRILVNGLLIVAIVLLFPGGVIRLGPWLWERAPAKRLLPRVLRSVKTRTPVRGVPERGVDGMLDPAKPVPNQTAMAVHATGITKRFGGVSALGGVDLTVDQGQITGLIGPNGSGKSTLVNVLSGAYQADAGTITIAGHSLPAKKIRSHKVAALGVARTFQTVRLIENATVYDNVLLGALVPTTHRGDGRRRRRKWPDERERVWSALDQAGISEIAYEPAGSLAYGLQRRVELARALMSRPLILMLDEPAAGMAPDESEQLFKLLGELASAGTAILIVEHDMEAIRTACHHLVVVDRGVRIAEGTPSDVLEHGAVLSAYVGNRANAH